MRQEQGNAAQATRLLDESLTLKRALSDCQGIAASLRQSGALAAQRGETRPARALFEESLEISPALEERNGIDAALDALANLGK